MENAFGSFAEHRAALEALLINGVEPLADIVINHRDGLRSWADFRNPDWGLWAITRNDDAFIKDGSPIQGTPEHLRGAPEESPAEYARHGGTTYEYDSFRDIDHTSEQVRRDIIRYLLQLRSIGYRGWRYDMVHGFHARWLSLYNKRSNPTFSVGEYEWNAHDDARGWVWHTAVIPGQLPTASCVFDFATQFTLKDQKSNYRAWHGLGNGLGMMGDNTDGQPWKQKAVTFLENHDTGYRTHPNGEPEEHHTADSFANNWEVEQSYAYILTHPGIPCVYWKHFFDWGGALRDKITGLINARKVADVHSGSPLHLQHNAREKGVYSAMIQGRKGRLYVRVGGNDVDWNPSASNYRDYREYVAGANWKVWVGLPGNPPIQHAPLKPAFPIPQYRDPSTIQVPDDWLE